MVKSLKTSYCVKKVRDDYFLICDAWSISDLFAPIMNVGNWIRAKTTELNTNIVSAVLLAESRKL